MGTTHLLTFIGIALLLALTPGPDMAMVTKSALRGGRRAAFLTTAGIACALAIHTTAASLGLAALLRAAADLFTVIKLIGGAYLAYLGVQALLNSFSRTPNDPTDAALTDDADRHRGAFRQGFLSALLNPKLLVFFATLLPQFVNQSSNAFPQMLALGLVFDLIGLTWLCSYAMLVTALRDFFASPSVRRRMERVTGIVLVGLGARLALERL